MIVDLTLAPLAVLAFLGAAVCTIALTVSIIVTRLSGKKQLSALLMKVLAGGLGMYFVLMLGFSAFSKDYDLRLGAEKHFCEIDCHLAYSVTKVERATVVPAEFAGRIADGGGQLYLVTLRTRFDETTIGPNRGNGQLTPNPREVRIRDDAGKDYVPAYAIAGTPLEQALRPGESYETRILLRVPQEAKNPKLFLGVSPWPNAFLIGHEDSPLHGKAYFDLKG
jgi:hypothetical protein